MQITWLGCAGFEIKTDRNLLLIDPFLTRNPDARPIQEKKPSDIPRADQIFISHGHFDHLHDVPDIAAKTGAAVFCSQTVARFLKKKGLRHDRIFKVRHDLQNFYFEPFHAQAIYSRHVRFDARLVLSTLARAKARLFSCLPGLTHFPCGQVLAWRFFINDKVLLFFGSAGASASQLSQISHPRADILLLPVQGHSNICDMGVSILGQLQPGRVIIHHHDDFFPPLSQPVDIRPFLEKTRRQHSRMQVIVPELNQPMTF